MRKSPYSRLVLDYEKQSSQWRSNFQHIRSTFPEQFLLCMLGLAAEDSVTLSSASLKGTVCES